MFELLRPPDSKSWPVSVTRSVFLCILSWWEYFWDCRGLFFRCLWPVFIHRSALPFSIAQTKYFGFAALLKKAFSNRYYMPNIRFVVVGPISVRMLGFVWCVCDRQHMNLIMRILRISLRACLGWEITNTPQLLTFPVSWNVLFNHTTFWFWS